MTQRQKVERSNPNPSYFVAWDEFGTRYRLFATPLASFARDVREEIGAAEVAVLVTLWTGGRGYSALFNAGGGPLVDAYVGEKLEIQGEDLAAVAPKLRALLVRPG